MSLVMNLSNPRRRLYLSKDGNGVYIDNCNLPQHQRDGIRFIYRQFELKNPGIILNDPSGYGKKLQVVLFIKAIRHALEDSVLIICNDNDAVIWLEHFREWTDFYDEVCIENFNPYKKKFVFINTMQNLQAFTSRQRSVIIIDNDIVTKEMLKLSYRCNFKIWMTSVEMKKNLDLFSGVYSWLFPKEKVEIDKFKINDGDASDYVTKTILFDAFTEEFLKRSEDFLTPFSVNKKPSTSVKQSRKRKDITGTKIKRTKRAIIDDDDDDNDIKVNSDIKHNNADVTNKNDNSKSENGVNDTGDQLKMDVETFKEPCSEVKVPELCDKIVNNMDSVDLFELDEMIDFNNISYNDVKQAIINVESDLVNDDQIKNIESETKNSCNLLLNKVDNTNKVSENTVDTTNKVSLNKDDNEVIDDHKMSVEESEVDDPNDSTQSHKSIDTIMKEYEHKIYDKFKGSLLDSLF